MHWFTYLSERLFRGDKVLSDVECLLLPTIDDLAWVAAPCLDVHFLYFSALMLISISLYCIVAVVWSMAVGVWVHTLKGQMRIYMAGGGS